MKEKESAENTGEKSFFFRGARRKRADHRGELKKKRVKDFVFGGFFLACERGGSKAFLLSFLRFYFIFFLSLCVAPSRLLSKFMEICNHDLFVSLMEIHVVPEHDAYFYFWNDLCNIDFFSCVHFGIYI